MSRQKETERETDRGCGSYVSMSRERQKVREGETGRKERN